MRGKLYTKKEKEKIKKMLLSGKSYNTVRKLTGVPKSTISGWCGKDLRGPMTKAEMLKHLAEIRKSASAAISKKYRDIREEERTAIKTSVSKSLILYPFNNSAVYRSLTSMLYWAEGAKTPEGGVMKFANTDPQLMLLFITLLRKSYSLKEEKFRVGLYLHHYHSIKKVKKFWSKLLTIPLNKFYKVYIKKRSQTKRFRKNFVGICFLYYRDRKIQRELLELGHALQQKICARSSTG